MYLPKAITLLEVTLELQQFKHMVAGRSNSPALIPEPKENHLDTDQIFWSFSFRQHRLFRGESWPAIVLTFSFKVMLSQDMPLLSHSASAVLSLHCLNLRPKRCSSQLCRFKKTNLKVSFQTHICFYVAFHSPQMQLLYINISC